MSQSLSGASPGTIQFAEIPYTWKVPGNYMEVKAAINENALLAFPAYGLAMGQMFTSGVLGAPGAVYQITGTGQPGALFGVGSILAQQCEAWIKANPYTPLDAIGIADAASSVNATGSVTFAGTATAPATPVIYIGGARVPVGVNIGDTAATIAANAYAALELQSVPGNGIINGSGVEAVSSWRARILAKIRNEPSGGNAGDYVEWAEAALAGVTAVCPPGASGGGVVSVVCAMAGGVVPDSGQIAIIQAYINAQRPVTAVPTVYPCTLNPINVTLHLNPDTPQIRAAAAAALALSFEQDATIGGTTYFMRLNNAVSSSDGEYSHEMIAPTADVTAPTLFALNTLGTVNFE